MFQHRSFYGLFVTLIMLVATPVLSADYSGIWALQAGDRTIFRFEIARTSAGWAAVWVKPVHFQTDFESFSRVIGPVQRRVAEHVRELKNGLELSFDDPAPNAIPDVFCIEAVDATHVRATFIGANFEPLLLVAEAKDAPLGPWDPTQVYTRLIDRPTNAEMTSIFDADQKDRANSPIDWKIVAPADRLRQARTRALLDSGALHSGTDYEHAAFVFQHGAGPEDFLMAHILATVAVARGNPAATWIAAATLDRYLQNIGRPQIFGTQFSTKAGNQASQEPFARMLLPDALRQAMKVPPLSEQEEQRKIMHRDAVSAEP